MDRAVNGHGVALKALRVELPTDGTGVVGLNAGTFTIGNRRGGYLKYESSQAKKLTSQSARGAGHIGIIFSTQDSY